MDDNVFRERVNVKFFFFMRTKLNIFFKYKWFLKVSGFLVFFKKYYRKSNYRVLMVGDIFYNLRYSGIYCFYCLRI